MRLKESAADRNSLNRRYKDEAVPSKHCSKKAYLVNAMGAAVEGSPSLIMLCNVLFY